MVRSFGRSPPRGMRIPPMIGTTAVVGVPAGMGDVTWNVSTLPRVFHLVWGLGFRVQGSGFGVQGSGFRVQGSGFGVEDSGCEIYLAMKRPSVVGVPAGERSVPASTENVGRERDTVSPTCFMGSCLVFRVQCLVFRLIDFCITQLQA